MNLQEKVGRRGFLKFALLFGASLLSVHQSAEALTFITPRFGKYEDKIRKVLSHFSGADGVKMENLKIWFLEDVNSKKMRMIAEAVRKKGNEDVDAEIFSDTFRDRVVKNFDIKYNLVFVDEKISNERDFEIFKELLEKEKVPLNIIPIKEPQFDRIIITGYFPEFIYHTDTRGLHFYVAAEQMKIYERRGTLRRMEKELNHVNFGTKEEEFYKYKQRILDSMLNELVIHYYKVDEIKDELGGKELKRILDDRGNL